MLTKMRNRNSRVIWVCALIILSMTLPIIAATKYGVPCDDDFSNSLIYLSERNVTLGMIMKNASTLYNSWQGTYFGNLLAMIPVYMMWGTLGLRIEMLSVTILFFIALFMAIKGYYGYYARKAGKNFDKGALPMAIMYMAVVGYGLSTKSLGEFFYWHTGICMYTIPFAMCSLSISVFFSDMNRNRTAKTILACVFALLGCGGALNLAGVLCYMMLLIVVQEWIEGQRNAARITIFICTVLGAFLNTIAPGNYIRHNNYDTSLNIIKAVANSVFRINRVIAEDLESGILLLVLVMAFWCGYRMQLERTIKKPLVFVALCYLGMIVSDFPVALGVNANVFPWRCAIVERFSVGVFVLSIGMYLGNYMAHHFNITKTWASVCLGIVALHCIGMINPTFALEYTPYKTAIHLVKGDYRVTSDSELEILDEIKYSGDKDIQITKQTDTGWTDLKTIDLREEKEYWVNQDIAQYYGKESIVLKHEQCEDEN